MDGGITKYIQNNLEGNKNLVGETEGLRWLDLVCRSRRDLDSTKVRMK